MYPCEKRSGCYTGDSATPSRHRSTLSPHTIYTEISAETRARGLYMGFVTFTDNSSASRSHCNAARKTYAIGESSSVFKYQLRFSAYAFQPQFGSECHYITTPLSARYQTKLPETTFSAHHFRRRSGHYISNTRQGFTSSATVYSNIAPHCFLFVRPIDRSASFIYLYLAL